MPSRTLETPWYDFLAARTQDLLQNLQHRAPSLHHLFSLHFLAFHPSRGKEATQNTCPREKEEYTVGLLRRGYHMTTGNSKEKGCQHAGIHKLIHQWVIKTGPAPPKATKQLSGFDFLEAAN